jgi:hypothetical protein
MTTKDLTNLVGTIYDATVAAGLFIGELVRIVVSFLASATIENDTNVASNNAARGGVLNYRTMMFDDGTDAGGWYEKD